MMPDPMGRPAKQTSKRSIPDLRRAALARRALTAPTGRPSMANESWRLGSRDIPERLASQHEAVKTTL